MHVSYNEWILILYWKLDNPCYSLGDYLAISAQGKHVKFSTTIWGVLAILTDIVFRGLFLAYMFSIIKAKTFPLLGRVIY